MDDNIFIDEKFMISELKPRVSSFHDSLKIEMISIDDSELKASMSPLLLTNSNNYTKIEKSQSISSLKTIRVNSRIMK